MLVVKGVFLALIVFIVTTIIPNVMLFVYNVIHISPVFVVLWLIFFTIVISILASILFVIYMGNRNE